MSYRLELDEPLAEGIRRACREELEVIIASLRDESVPHESVHDARERLKRVRAALRLVRDAMGEDRFRAANVFFRDRGRELSELRDARVAVDTLDGLLANAVERATDGEGAIARAGAAPSGPSGAAERSFERAYGVLRPVLECGLEQTVRHQLRDERRHERVAGALEDALPRVDDWPIEGRGFGMIAHGLERIYRQGRKRLAKAYEDPSLERFHDWRKRVKDLWYHVRLLEASWPPVMSGSAEGIHELSDLLGDSTDLSVLGDLVSGLDVPGLAPADRSALLCVIARRRDALRERARPVGERVFHESPAAFAGRMDAYFEAWRSR